jgi:hypothetical protein
MRKGRPVSAETHTEQARKYIDEVRQINQRYGQGDTVSSKRYERAVQEVAAAFRGVRPKDA